MGKWDRTPTAGAPSPHLMGVDSPTVTLIAARMVKDVLFEDASGQLLLPVRGLRPLSPGSQMVLCVERRWAPRCTSGDWSLHGFGAVLATYSCASNGISLAIDRSCTCASVRGPPRPSAGTSA